MSAWKPATGLLALLALAVGGWVYQLTATRRLREELSSAAAQIVTRDRQREADLRYAANLEREAAELSFEVKQLRLKTDATAPPVSAPPIAPAAHTLLAKINQERMANVLVTAVINGKVSSGFTRLFDLTEGEVEQLNAALQVTRARVDEALPPAQRVRVENGYVVIELPAFSAGDDIREQLLDEFSAILGDARYAALEATKGLESIDRAFEGFGSSARQITISRVPEGRPGGPGFRLMDGRVTPGGSSSAKEVTFTNPTALPAPYAWLAPLLPPLAGLPPPSGRIQLTPSTAR